MNFYLNTYHFNEIIFPNLSSIKLAICKTGGLCAIANSIVKKKKKLKWKADREYYKRLGFCFENIFIAKIKF